MNDPNFSLTLAGAFVCGSISAYLAHRRGKSPYRWFFLGFFMGVIGLLATFFFVPKKKGALFIPPLTKPEPILEGPVDKFWYYLDSQHQQVGPLSYQALSDALRQGIVSPSTYIWHEDLDNWKHAKELLQERAQEEAPLSSK